MKSNPILSIVVPSRDGKIDFLRTQLSQQTFKNWELIVSAGHPSPALARNIGASQAQCPFILFLDDDIHLSHKTFLSEILKSLLSVGPYAVVGVNWKVPPDANSFQKYIYQQSFHDYETPNKRSKETFRVVPWMDTVGGCCMGMRRDTFEELGGFDTRLVAGEDPELLYRLWLRGGKVCLLSNVWVYHYPPDSPKTLLKKTLWYSKGASQFTKKHPESNYRIILKSIWHAAALLFLHTLALIPLIFIKLSFHHKKPSFAFRPLLAVMTYVGFWAYCIHWFKQPRIPNAPLPSIVREYQESSSELEVLR